MCTWKERLRAESWAPFASAMNGRQDAPRPVGRLVRMGKHLVRRKPQHIRAEDDGWRRAVDDLSRLLQENITLP
ncbi:hypothetical protein E2R60_25135 [Paenibacillus dendritiformis]|uniref:hypothetical protein n=1 Tax=Paenibacillus dendritiformis TaxID=130049 RepID=UPI001059C7EA|nr:hypothetical protein [Paenibacillus dendritiformis]TDL49302.1 hypothetical protein E2R60_25135 [Paenibacillus dendritiformis]